MKNTLSPVPGLIAAAMVAATALAGPVPQFRIDAVERVAGGGVRLTAGASLSDYHVLLEGGSLLSVTNPVAASLGNVLEAGPAGATTRFYRIRRIPLAAPGDLDGDGMHDVFELEHPRILDPLSAADARIDSDDDGDSNLAEFQRGTDPESGGPTRLRASSPASGETGVSVTRETVLRFSRPLAADTVLGVGNFYAEAAGRRLLTRAELSTDRRKATLFYLENMPANSRVRVTLLGGGLRDMLGQAPDLDDNRVAGGDARIDFETSGTMPLAGTAVIGRVFASQPVPGPSGTTGSSNRPLAGVTITVDGAEESLRTMTDDDGSFTLSPCPAGRFFVHVDGRTAPASKWPDGAYYPFVGKAWEAQAGVMTNLAGGSGEIFLPLIPAGALKEVSATESTVVTFPPGVIAANPALDGVSITIPPNTLFSENGARGGRVGMAPVPPDRLPEPLPPGLDPAIVITIQTDGPQNFDRPVPVRFPNLPDPRTGIPLPPGGKTALWSFNHDTGRWEMQGPMTISADGRFADTDPGVGVLQPGWHGPFPGGGGNDEDDDDTNDDGICKKEFANLQSATAQFYLGVFGGMVEVAPGIGCVASFAQGWAGYTFDCYRDFDNCTAINGVNYVIGSALGCIPFGVGSTASAWWSIATAVEPAAEALKQCLQTNGVNSNSALFKSAAAIPGDVFQEQAALWTAGGELFALVTGSTNWTSINPDGVPLWNAFFESLQTAVEPGSEAAGRIGNGERAALLALPLPPPLTSQDAERLLNRFDGMLGGTARFTRDELERMGAAATNLLEVARELERRGWTTTQDAYERGTSGGVVAPAAAAAGAWKTVGFTPEPPRPIQEGWYRLTDTLTGFQTSGRLRQDGSLPQQIFAANRIYTVHYYNHTRQRVSVNTFRAGPAGGAIEIPTGMKMPVFGDVTRGFEPQPDADSDGLSDIAEAAVGTDPANPDSDGDGIADGWEVQRGENPLDGFPVTTGPAGGTATLGTAVHLAVRGDLALVADSAGGVAVFDVSPGAPPGLLTQIDTPGTAQGVAIEGDMAVVADGPQGLAVLDISNPAGARLVRQIALEGATATAVALADGFAYAAAGNRGVYVVDTAAGAIAGHIDGVGTVGDVALENDVLHVLTTTHLRTYLSAVLGLDPLGEIEVPGELGSGSIRRLAICEGIAYVGGSSGHRTVDVSRPEAPEALASPAELQAAVHHLAHDGSRTLATISSGGSGTQRRVDLYDTSNPRSSTNFVAAFDLPGNERALAWHRGRLLVASESAGLQSLNPLPPDLARRAPEISVGSWATDADPARPGTQVTIGTVIRPAFTVSDDRQVARVELLVNGAVADMATGCPFTLSAPVGSGTSAILRLRAFDSGGNMSETAGFPVDLVAGPAGATLLRSSPPAGAAVAPPSAVRLVFASPLTRVPEIRLVRLGTNGTADMPVGGASAVLEVGGRVLHISVGDMLEPGDYRATAGGTTLDFRVIDPPGTVRWLGNDGGNWSDASRWSGGVVPGPTNHVVIASQGTGPVVTLNVNASVASVRAGGMILTGRTLTVSGGSASIIRNGTGLANASITVRGAGTSLIVGGVTEAVSASLFAFNGATLSLPDLVTWRPDGIAGGELRAEGYRSAVYLPALERATGPLGNFLFGGLSELIIKADLAGTLSAPGLGPVLDGEVSLIAQRGGVLRIPNVNAMLLGSPDPTLFSRIDVTGGSRIDAPPFTRLSGVRVHAGQGSPFDATALVAVTNSVFTLDDMDAVFARLDSAEAMSIDVNGGRVVLPALAAHTGGAVWSADLAGSLLSFPALRSLTGPVGDAGAGALNITANVGGTVDLSAVVGEANGRITFLANGDRRFPGTRIIANGISRIRGTPVAPGRIGQAVDGVLEMASLTNASHLEIRYGRTSGLGVPTLATLDGGTILAADSQPDLSQFARLTDVSLYAGFRGTILIPGSTEIRLDGAYAAGRPVVWGAEDPVNNGAVGGSFSFMPRQPVVRTGSNPVQLAIRSVNAGSMDLASLPVMPAVPVSVQTAGNSATIKLTGLTNLSTVTLLPSSGFVAGGNVISGGTIELDPGATRIDTVVAAPFSEIKGGLVVVSQLRGSGEINASVELATGGALAPGTENVPLGNISIRGDYTQNSGAFVHVEEIGGLADRVTVTGDAVIDGIVNFTGNVFESARYPIIEASTITGEFQLIAPERVEPPGGPAARKMRYSLGYEPGRVSVIGELITPR
jgi:hypothetical protein